MKKVAIIAQARMASTRLPGKIMLSVKGKPLLAYFVERLKDAQVPLYLASTTNPNNDILEAFAKEYQVNFFRGDEGNVLKRYYDCAKKNNVDVIVRVTSDCPLIEGKMIADAVKTYLEFNNEHIYYSNCAVLSYPHGMNYEIFSFALLEEAYEHADTEFQKEHVSPFINKNVSGNVIIKNDVRDRGASQYRITIDTYNDYLLIKRLIEEYGADKKTTDEIINIFETHPELALINRTTEPHLFEIGKDRILS